MRRDAVPGAYLQDKDTLLEGVGFRGSQLSPDAFNGCEGLTIVAPEGSTAYSFAITEGFNWRAQ